MTFPFLGDSSSCKVSGSYNLKWDSYMSWVKFPKNQNSTKYRLINDYVCIWFASFYRNALQLSLVFHFIKLSYNSNWTTGSHGLKSWKTDILFNLNVPLSIFLILVNTWFFSVILLLNNIIRSLFMKHSLHYKVNNSFIIIIFSWVSL